MRRLQSSSASPDWNDCTDDTQNREPDAADAADPWLLANGSHAATPEAAMRNTATSIEPEAEVAVVGNVIETALNTEPDAAVSSAATSAPNTAPKAVVSTTAQNTQPDADSREAFARDIFLAIARGGFVGSAALREIACATGFEDNTDENWEREWQGVCTELGASPRDGLDESNFAMCCLLYTSPSPRD